MTTAAVATTNNGTQHHTTISSEHHQYDRLLCLLLLSFVNPLFIIMSKPVTTFWRMAGLSYLQVSEPQNNVSRERESTTRRGLLLVNEMKSAAAGSDFFF
uniref:Uncharacterized protein n=1 Tax=Amphora coffeiformis TaxID=265554 RepID=A0A7S3L852_9STRA